MIRDEHCDFGSFYVHSRQLAKNLDGCASVLLFGATVGVEIDRLIAKYGRISPARALMLQAIGAERIEALCDAFCREYAEENGVGLRPVSAGLRRSAAGGAKVCFCRFGLPKKNWSQSERQSFDVPIQVGDCFCGNTEEGNSQSHKCDSCENVNCSYRSTL